ncbi:MAG: helix-turn-helix domain-containing protein, partial [Bacteroidota bacterium]
MTLALNTETLFLLIVILAGILSIPVLLLSKKNRKANSLLAGVQLAVAGSLFHNLLLTGGIYESNPDLYFLPVGWRLALGPLLWGYAKLQTDARLNKSFGLHFLPLAAVVGFECWAFQHTAEEKWMLWQKIDWFWDVAYFWLYQIQLLIYLILTLLIIKKWNAKIENQLSDTSRISLRWLKILSGVILLLLLAGSSWKIIAGETEFCIMFPVDIVRGAMLVMIGWFSIRQSQIITINRESEPATIPPETKNTIDLSIPIAEENKPAPVDEELLRRIRDAMQTEKLYLNPELSLYQLARTINTPAKLVSATINRGTNQTFQAFVNSYRVKEVISRLEAGQQKQLTLLAIACDCGFNSKATFNRVFRDQTGSAPGNCVSNSA